MRTLFLTLFVLFGAHFFLSASPQWIQKADYGNFGRHRATGMAIGNKVYAGTGHLNGTGFDTWYPDWWEYDVGTNAWTQKADYPGNNGNGDQDIVSISFDNVGYAGLGQLDGTGFYKFDPQLNLWTQVASPPTGSFNNTFPFRIGDFGYFPALFSTAIYRYDPANDQWISLNPLPFSTNFGIPTMAINGKGYIKNGVDFYEYDVATDNWSMKAPFPGLYPNRPAMIHQNGFGYVVGGSYGSNWTWGSEVWRYDPSLDSWTQMDDFEGTTRRWAVLVNDHDRVFYGLGTNGTNFNDWWEFVPNAGLEEKASITIKTFPNPCTDFVEITATTDQFEVHLYNNHGAEVSHATTTHGTAKLATADLAPGVYFYSVSGSAKETATGKIVVE